MCTATATASSSSSSSSSCMSTAAARSPACPRRRRSRGGLPRSSSSSVLCGLLLLSSSASLNLPGVQATPCSSQELNERNALLATNKSIFQACLSDLKRKTTPSSVETWTSFITHDYVSNPDRADAACASDHCVRALIVAMESLPDCCSGDRNLPRVADDILHQCDLRDARQLQAELEAEIAKLPDLKVQIKSVDAEARSMTDDGSRATSGGSQYDEDADGVDVIIDVKKRELIKSGELSLDASVADGSGGQGTHSGATAMGARDGSISRMVVALIAVAVAIAPQFL